MRKQEAQPKWAAGLERQAEEGVRVALSTWKDASLITRWGMQTQSSQRPPPTPGVTARAGERGQPSELSDETGRSAKW